MTTAAACPRLQQQLSDVKRLNRYLENEVECEVGEVERRREWLECERCRNRDRCAALSDITRCLQHQAQLCVHYQRHLLDTAITRRGLRALRPCPRGKVLLNTVQLLPETYVGVDYIAGLFDPRCHGNIQRPQQPFNVDCQSSLTDVHILYVDRNGDHIRLINNSISEKELGAHSLVQLQNVDVALVAEYQFPARLQLPPLGVVTLWACLCARVVHCPPTDFICDTVSVWNTGSDYTTVLRRPDGQAIAWTRTGRLKLPDKSQQEDAAAATATGGAGDDKDDDASVVFWSVSEMIRRATETSQHQQHVVVEEQPALDKQQQQQQELTNSVTVRVPAASRTGVRQSVMFPCLRVDSRRHDTHRLSSDITAQHSVSPHRLPPIPEVVKAGAPASRMGSAPLAIPKPFSASNSAVCNPRLFN